MTETRKSQLIQEVLSMYKAIDMKAKANKVEPKKVGNKEWEQVKTKLGEPLTPFERAKFQNKMTKTTKEDKQSIINSYKKQKQGEWKEFIDKAERDMTSVEKLQFRKFLNSKTLKEKEKIMDLYNDRRVIKNLKTQKLEPDFTFKRDWNMSGRNFRSTEKK